MSTASIPLVTDARQGLVAATEPWRRAFVLPWLCSAAVVTLIRAFHTADLRYDLTIQLQAAQNLLLGKGLATYTATSKDLADPLTLVTLTYFPSGYSFCASGLLLLGATPAVAMKMLGALATMLGWLGWAGLGLAYAGTVSRFDTRWRPIVYAAGFATPLVYTLPWGGTDIFLWACIPWVLKLLTRRTPQSALRWDMAAGALAGVAVLFRYAGAFLALYGLGVIVWQCGARLRHMARRLTACTLGLAAVVAVQGWINIVIARSPFQAGGVTLPGATAGAAGTWIHAPHPAVANTPIVFWTPDAILEFATGDTLFGHILGLVLVVALPGLVVAAIVRERRRPNRDDALAAAAAPLLLAIPVFLFVCEVYGATGYSREPRYYAPLIPLAVFQAWFIATNDGLRTTRFGRVCRIAGAGYVIAFTIVTFARVFMIFGSGEVAEHQRARMLGTNELRSWPSSGVSYDTSEARRYVAALMHARPDAILITNVENWFYTDTAMDLSRIHRIESCRQLVTTEVNGPVHVFILASDLGGPRDELLVFSEQSHGRATCFERLKPFTPVRVFAEEHLKLLERSIPAGSRVTLKDVQPE